MVQDAEEQQMVEDVEGGAGWHHVMSRALLIIINL